MAFLGGLLGHRDATVRAVGAPGTAPGAQAIQDQLRQGGEAAQRQALGMGAARGSTALNRMAAQQYGSSAMTQANVQASIARQQLEQNRLNQQFQAQLQAQQMNEAIRAQNAQTTGQLVGGAAMLGGAALLSDIRAKQDVGAVPGWLGGYMAGQAPSAPAAYEGEEPMPGYYPEAGAPMPGQSPVERAALLHGRVLSGRVDMAELSPHDADLVRRYGAYRAQQQVAGAPDIALADEPAGPTGVLGQLRRSQPSAYERGYRAMSAQLGPPVNPTAPMQPYQYRYTPEAAAQMGTDTAPRVGPMAHEMAASPLYASSVVQRPDGMLGIDPTRAQQATMAGLADVNNRMHALEDERMRLGRYAAAREGGREAYPVRIRRDDSGPGREYGEGYLPPSRRPWEQP